MDPYIESPQVAFVPGSSLRTYSPFSLSRLALPALCVAIAVSVGTATGISLAMVNAPNGVVEASSSSVRASSVRAESGTKLAAKSNAAPIDQTAGSAPLAASPSQLVADNGHLALKAGAPRLSTANPAGKARPSSAAQIAFSNPPDAAEPAIFRLAGKEWPVARPIFIAVSAPVRHQVASASVAAPTVLDPTRSSIDNAAKPASRFIEGDLTIAAYDATTGMVQASDGRTFILGTTVAAGNATSWDEYRSGVHYRCDQSGSCLLMRAGAVAPSARLI